MVVTEVHVTVIIRTTRASPATTLALVGEMSMGVSSQVVPVGECFRHS